MTTLEKLSALRAVMDRECIDAYIVSGTDPHNSEYLPAAWKQREWISGFTGSYGTIVVMKDDAGLWTDTRYFIQADKQLQGTGIRLHKLKVPEALDYPEWLAKNLPENSRVGLDSFCTSVCDMKRLTNALSRNNIKVVEKTDLIGEIWMDRPALPEAPVFLVPTKTAGASAAEKIGTIQKFLAEKNADYYLFSCLDEIAWLYNIRCNDIDYNPVAISYAVVGKERAWLFVKERKIPAAVLAELQQQGIEVRDYHHLFLFLDELDKKSHFIVDAATLNYAVFGKINSCFTLSEQASPIVLAKSVKNPTEIEGFKKACILDGVSLTKFFYWLEGNIGNNLTEISVSEKLSSFRAMIDDCVSDSFKNISAYGANAALPHYSAVPGEDANLQAKGFYLIDSGGQYPYGTTDITRTIPLGELTHAEKEDYTLVLKGMIALTRCIFPKGTKGCNMDIVARHPLWSNMRNYGHGTGHGIGFFLNVHEGPQAIRQELKDQDILPGMVTSDEPGIYREGLYGIRHENMNLCVKLDTNEFGEWYGFEPLSLCYIDTTAIVTDLMTEGEKEWLNNYHKIVCEKITPYLTQEEAAWLAEKTRPI